uniref:Cleft lip and palate transmembrane 1 n=1 Tax=Calcidiscus leptoporus TaxID=127549 RepID=A0A7S0ITG2_9EUKA|mmetsp:Transcript_21689/g.49847  ORF Transcript_21689/g.49847 Transcript_21689/m.49847 type:complete len:602 (+) Transcript_21689:12-1817(+)
MAEAADAQGEGDGRGGSMMTMIFRSLVMYFIVSHFFRSRTTSSDASPQVHMQPQSGAVAPLTHHSNAWRKHTLYELRVYVSEHERFDAFGDASALVWLQKGLVYAGDTPNEAVGQNVTVQASLQVQRNESSLWAHIYASVAGTSPDATQPNYKPLSTSEAHTPLIKLTKRKRRKATKHLLSGEFKDNLTVADATELNELADELEPYWKGSLSLHLVEDFTVFPAKSIPPQVRQSMTIDRATGKYMPVIFCSEMWSLKEQHVPINESTPTLPLSLSWSPISLMRWQLTAQMQASLEMQASLHGDDAMDEVRRMLGETSPWLLALTAFVSILHSLFDFLAFKNDISFWKNNKSMKGLSLGSMLLNFFFQTVIFLYLLDSETSYMILVSNGVGLAIEVWKVRKAVKSISVRVSERGRLPRLVVVPADSYTLSETKVHDEEAMRYLSCVMYPLVVGYSLYSLSYEAHKSWYSWLLGSIVGCVYTFGFIMMTPQLFINYKLKSTAHMPWKTFMYKALNTFVDDLFAFIIKMPTMHRLSCLRDDLIFVVYLYQRWSYGVDTSRANEYGQVAADETDELALRAGEDGCSGHAEGDGGGGAGEAVAATE